MGSVQSKSMSSAGSFLEYERIIYLLKRGDLVEIHRGKYKHWVICEQIDKHGNVWCFHVTGNHYDDRKEVAFNGKALIKYEPLFDILRDNGDREPSLCRVNNQENVAKDLLRKTKNEQPIIDDVFKHLHRKKDTLINYDVKSHNCEHFVTLVKYGIGWSSQVNSVQDILTAGLKFATQFSRTGAEICNKQGYYKWGAVCLIVAAVCEVAAKIVENISFMLESGELEEIFKHAIAY